MRSLEELSLIDRNSRVGEFASLLRHVAKANGDFIQAEAVARRSRAPQRVCEVLRAAVGSGGIAWGEALAGYRTLANGFKDELRHSSILFRMLSDGAVIKLPLGVRVGSIVESTNGAIVAPGQPIAVSTMSLATSIIEARKAAGLLVVSNQLLEEPGVESLITRSLRRSVGSAVDADFISTLLAGASTIQATDSVLGDLRALLELVGITSESRAYWCAASDVGRRLSTLGETSVGSPPSPTGARVFPTVSPTGGLLLDLPFVTSNAVPDGNLLLADASGIGANSGLVEVETSSAAALEMSDAPSMSMGVGSPPMPSASPVVSLFQTNATGIKAVAEFGAAKMRPDCVAGLTGISW